MTQSHETELDQLFEKAGLRETLQRLHSEGRIGITSDDSLVSTDDQTDANHHGVCGSGSLVLGPWGDIETTKQWIRSLPAEIAGKYGNIEPMDSGGFGVICRAFDKKLNRKVAMKFHRIRSPAMADLATSEGRAAAQTTCPHIVQVYDVVSYKNDQILVLEWIDGWDLTTVLERAGPLSGQNVAEIAIAICRALEVIHENGHVHRDIKPSNVMLSRSGEIKVTDFGLADIPRSWSQPSTDDEDSLIVGTENYLAPEQRIDPTAVDGRADLYALAMSMLQLITGQTPPRSDRRRDYDFESAMMVAQRKSAMPVRDQRRLAKLIATMAQTNPDRRPQTPAEVILQLQSIASGSDLKQLCRRAESPANHVDASQNALAKPRIAKTWVLKAWRWNAAVKLATMAMVVFAIGWFINGRSDVPGNQNTATPMAPAGGNKFQPKKLPAIAAADLDGLWTVAEAYQSLQKDPAPMQFLIDQDLAFLLIRDRLAAWGSIQREAMAGENQDRFLWKIKGKGRLLVGAIRLSKERPSKERPSEERPSKERLSLALESEENPGAKIDFSPKLNRFVMTLADRRSIDSVRKAIKQHQADSPDLLPWLMQEIASGRSPSQIKGIDLTRCANRNRRKGFVDPPELFFWQRESADKP